MTLGPLSEIRKTGEGRLKKKMGSSFCPAGLCRRHSRRCQQSRRILETPKTQGCQIQVESHWHAEIV